MVHRPKPVIHPEARGWYRYSSQPPTQDGCTVDPIKRRKDLQQITELLQPRPRDLALWILGINTGFRAGDLLGLTWKDLLTPDGQVKHMFQLNENKTSHKRRLPLGPVVRRALSRWLSCCGGPDRVDAEAYVFAGRSGRPITVQRLHQMINEWTEAIGLSGNYGSHTLRKTFGYWLHEKGAPVREIQDIFGHSCPSITTRYIGIDQGRVNRRIVELNLC